MNNLIEILKGGKGSGNFGHTGRAGKRGGSGGGGGKGKPRRGRRSREALDKEIKVNKRNDAIISSSNVIDKQVKQKRPRKSKESKILSDMMEDHLMSDFPISVAQDIGKKTGLHFRTDVAKFFDDWNTGSSKIMTQYAEAASAEFNVPLSSYEKTLIKNQKSKNEDEIKKIKDRFSPEDAAILLNSRKILPLEDRKKIVREVYESTQKYFNDKGITEVLMYRGYVASKDDKAALDAKEGQSAQYNSNSVESWTLAQGVAQNFANTPSRNDIRMVFAVKMPVERILSIPQTGAGVAKEQEFIVLGNGTDEIFVRNKKGT